MGLRYLTSGESHGPGLLAILEGLPAGLPVEAESINAQLHRRQVGFGSGPRMQIEHDQVRILGGVMEGVTIGSPLGLWIENRNHEEWKGQAIEPSTRPRPGHADLAATVKYGYRDLRPALERASARETAAKVAVGAVCRQFLLQFGIELGGYVASIGTIQADVDDISLDQRAHIAEGNPLRCPDSAAADEMQAQIQEIMEQGDTLGGTIEVFVTGLPAGLGSHVHWDRRLDSRLGAAVLGIPAIKGVEIGQAFENSRKRGTQVHDPILLQGQELVRSTNLAGGVEAGVSTGQPLVIRAAMKPIATTLHSQATVDLSSGERCATEYERSDFCPVPRAVPILEAAVAYVLAEALLEKLGGDSLEEMMPRFQALRSARLTDLPMDKRAHIFWPDEES